MSESIRKQVDGYVPISARASVAADEERQKLEKRIETLTKGLESIDMLIRESAGVFGLHMNGDPSPWSELHTSGRFGEWLMDFDLAMMDIEKNKQNRS